MKVSVSYRVFLRRQWPYWNWVVWERVSGIPGMGSAIVDEGLTLRRETARRRADALVAEMKRRDAELGWMDTVATNLADCAAIEARYRAAWSAVRKETS